MPSKVKRALAWSASLLVVFGLATTAYGVLVEPRLVLDERRYAVELPGLGERWAGAEVAVFSDLQVGMWWANTAMARRVVDEVVAEDPSVLLIAGDFVYGTSPDVPEQVDAVLELLEPVREAGIPTFAVLGNHDHAVGAADELTTDLADAGVTVLDNDAARMSAAGAGPEPLYVVGLAATRPGLTDVDQALSDVPEDAARVVLMHNPTAFPRLPGGSAPLAVAGHTHCGQVALPFLGQWSYLGLTEEEKVVADGFAPAAYGEEGNRLFVTCGVGFSLLPVRIGAPPQLVVFELRPVD